MKQEKKLVLIIEDHCALMHSISQELLSDYYVIKASNGIEGIEMIRKHKPHLIILDLLLPGKSGEEVLKLIKSQKGNYYPKVIVLTNIDSPEIKNITFEYQIEAYLLKCATSLKALANKVSVCLA